MWVTALVFLYAIYGIGVLATPATVGKTNTFTPGMVAWIITINVAEGLAVWKLMASSDFVGAFWIAAAFWASELYYILVSVTKVNTSYTISRGRVAFLVFVYLASLALITILAFA